MNPRNTLRTTYRNSVRFDLLALLGVLVLCLCVLVFRVAVEGNERHLAETSCEQIEAEIERTRLDIVESRERAGLMVERFALEDRVAEYGLDLVEAGSVTRIDLRPTELGNPTLTASR